jgi:hypothetical protein
LVPAQAAAAAADTTDAPVQPVSFGMRHGICAKSQPPIGRIPSAGDFKRHLRRPPSMSVQNWVSGDSHTIPKEV